MWFKLLLATGLISILLSVAAFTTMGCVCAPEGFELIYRALSVSTMIFAVLYFRSLHNNPDYDHSLDQ